MTETYALTEALDSKSVEYAHEHEFSTLLGVEIPERKVSYSANYSVAPTVSESYLPEIEDLVRLHRFVRERKVFTVLEFGVGYSNIIMADALRRNAEEFEAVKADFPKIRQNNPFELHAVDSNEEYIGFAAGRVPEQLRPFVTMHHSGCTMGTFNDRVCHYYDTLPNICPDFIYLDAPGQYDVQGDIRNISTRHQDRLPMSADLAAMEHFLQPGTLIVVDGRTANARFLRCSFQRNWRYLHDVKGDIHTFELLEAPLGAYNEESLRYSLGDSYFERLAKQA